MRQDDVWPIGAETYQRLDSGPAILVVTTKSIFCEVVDSCPSPIEIEN